MSDLEILFLIVDWQGYIMAFCCALYFLYFTKFGLAQKIISYYLFFLLTVNVVMKLLANEKVANLAFTHIAVLGEFIFLALFFREVLKNQTLFKKYFRVFLGVTGGLIIANTLFVEKINSFNTNAKIMVLFLIIFLATSFFLDRSKRLMEVDVHEKALRIINTAILLYYAGSFFVYLFYKFTLNDMIFYSNKMLIFNSALYLIFTLLMLSAVIIVINRPKQMT